MPRHCNYRHRQIPTRVSGLQGGIAVWQKQRRGLTGSPRTQASARLALWKGHAADFLKRRGTHIRRQLPPHHSVEQNMGTCVVELIQIPRVVGKDRIMMIKLVPCNSQVHFKKKEPRACSKGERQTFHPVGEDCRFIPLTEVQQGIFPFVGLIVRTYLFTSARTYLSGFDRQGTAMYVDEPAGKCCDTVDVSRPTYLLT